jgi:hypothetical protein
MDGGANWQSIAGPAGSYYLRAVDFVDEYDGWAVGRFGTIIHTSDGGNTWGFQANPATATLFDVDFSDNMHGLACGYGMILYTTNGGQNWNIGNPGIHEGTENTAEGTALSVHPNPFRNHLVIKIQNPNPKSQANPNSQTVIKIYDSTGQLVKSFDLSTLCSATPLGGLLSTSLEWNGKDDSGRRLPAGVYMIALEGDGTRLTHKTVLLE